MADWPNEYLNTLSSHLCHHIGTLLCVRYLCTGLLLCVLFLCIATQYVHVGVICALCVCVVFV